YAIKSLEEYREKFKKLVTEDPTNADRQRELSVTDFTIALLELFSQRKDYDYLSQFQKYYRDTAQPAPLKPPDPRLERDLAPSHAVLGTIFEHRSEPKLENLQK